MEETICLIPSAALQLEVMLCEGLKPQEEVQDDGRRGVVRAVVELRDDLALLFFTLFDPAFEAFWSTSKQNWREKGEEGRRGGGEEGGEKKNQTYL